MFSSTYMLFSIGSNTLDPYTDCDAAAVIVKAGVQGKTGQMLEREI